ncbi:hypothetical protein TNCV_4209561 [Trichonephila clavipes]|nr:hypothetical protein TNCV_4209561 [Trichonephila clavipes]
MLNLLWLKALTLVWCRNLESGVLAQVSSLLLDRGLKLRVGRGSQVVKVSDHGWRVMSSSPVPLKTRRVGERCTLNLSSAQASSRWCGVVIRSGGANSGVVLVT